MKYLLALIVALTLATHASGQTDAAYGVRYTPQSIELPADQDRPYVTLFGDRKDPRFAAVRKWFAENPTLARLKAQAHYAELPTDSAMYRERYKSTAPATLPAVRIQAADGTVLDDIAVPMTAQALGNGIANCFRQAPTIESPPATPPPAADHTRWFILAALTIAAGIASAVQQFKKGKK